MRLKDAIVHKAKQMRRLRSGQLYHCNYIQRLLTAMAVYNSK